MSSKNTVYTRKTVTINIYRELHARWFLLKKTHEFRCDSDLTSTRAFYKPEVLKAALVDTESGGLVL